MVALGFRKDHVDVFLQSPNALWAFKLESRSVFLVNFCGMRVQKNTRAQATRNRNHNMIIIFSIMVMVANFFALGTNFCRFLLILDASMNAELVQNSYKF